MRVSTEKFFVPSVRLLQILRFSLIFQQFAYGFKARTAGITSETCALIVSYCTIDINT